ncbi:MAG: pilus assembly protein FimV [Reinekea sp.]|jgi:pilus assembly protein FimV
MALRSAQEAVDEVRAQNAGAAPNLRAPTAANEAQLSATDTTGSALEGAGEVKNPDGYLELSADSNDGVSGAGETTDDVQQLLGQLSVAEELNDQYIRERDDLESKVTELQAQIEIMERLLDVQNSGIAEVQQALEQTADAQAAADAEIAAEAETAPVETPVESAPAVESTPVKATPPMPVKQDFMWYVNEYTGLVSNWVMKSTTNMAIVGGGLLLLLLIPFYIRSKRSGSDKVLSELNQEVESFEVDNDDISSDLDEDLLSDIEDDFDEVIEDEAEQIDAVMEAEMYMAYQKYDQAEEKLKEAFADYPGRADIGLKLMEVFAETGNVAGFNDIESRIELTAAQQDEAESLRAKLPIDQLDDDSSDLMMSGDDDFDLDLGDSFTGNTNASLESDLDFNLDSEDESSEPLLSASAETDDLSFDLDLDEDHAELSLDSEEPTSEPEELSTDLDFSLDLGDLDVDLSDESDDGFDFSIEEEVSPTAETPAQEESTDLDFSLDLTDEVSTVDEPAFELNLDEDDSLEDLESELSLDDELDSLEVESSLDVAPEELETGGLDLTDDLEDDSFDIDLSGDAPVEAEADPLQQLADSLDSDADLDEDEFDFLSGSDEISTKLDLARAYIEMEDKEGARDILDEVLQEGTAEQKSQAEALIQQM